MNSTTWLHHFQTNRLDRPEPDWDRHCWQDRRTARKLARSLSHIQLGEDVEGTFLLAGARRTHPDDPDYIEALRLFVAEEREHARLLERLVARFGGGSSPGTGRIPASGSFAGRWESSSRPRP